jgi:hypothetical protein
MPKAERGPQGHPRTTLPRAPARGLGLAVRLPKWPRERRLVVARIRAAVSSNSGKRSVPIAIAAVMQGEAASPIRRTRLSDAEDTGNGGRAVRRDWALPEGRRGAPPASLQLRQRVVMTSQRSAKSLSASG